jgi:hypothetical protein
MFLHVFQLESLPSVRAYPKFLAVLDNLIHLWIGVLSWSVIADDPWALNLDLCLVAIGASFIDLDHFLAAWSFSPDAAMHASHRGILHCTGLLFCISGFLYWKGKPHLALLLLVAFIPHHLRDAQRRGLYLIPFFPGIETPPIPKSFVRFFLPAYPWILNYFRTSFSPKHPSGGYLAQKVFNV